MPDTSIVERVAAAIDPEKWANFEHYCRLKDYTPAERAERLEASTVLQGTILRARAAIEAMPAPAYASFEDWFGEQQGFTLRGEWFDGDVTWLRAAFDAGRALTPSEEK